MDIRYGVDVSNKFDIMGFNRAAADAAKQKDEVKKTKKVIDGEKPKLGSNKQNTKKAISHPDSKGKQNDQNINKKEVQGKDSQPNERSNRGGRPNREPRDNRDNRDNKENDGERKPFRRPPREQREQQENRGGDENVPPEFREKPEGSNRFNRYDDGERGRGRGRRRGGFRDRGGRGGVSDGGRGGFGQPFDRKRDFDRHSGSDKTGVKAVDKREGGGRRNWGSFKDDIKNIEESQQSTQDGVTEPAENWNQNEDNVDQPENSEVPPGSAPETVNEEDAQPKQMTLKEYRASQNKDRMRAQFQIRKAGEGVDGSQWKDGTKIKKPVAVNSAPKPERRRRASESEEEESDDEHEDRKKKNKNTLNIEITFNDNNRRGGRGGGRRGRGTGRGFFPRGSPRGGGGRGGGDRKYREAAPRVDDEKDFPSLVKSVA